jgi:hypothetical protein
MFTTFYHGTLKKYVVIFGTIFNNIYINRVDANNEQIQTMKIPLSYGPKEKFLARLEGDPIFNRPAMVLPRMAFEISSISYAADRKLNTINRNIKINPTDPNQLRYQYMYVPYDIGFTLYIMAKNADDGTRIIEQIIPYFTPEWTLTANLIPELDLSLDIPVIINRVGMQDTYEGDFINRRAMVWTVDFTMKAYLFGPVKKQGVITLANTTFYVPQFKTIDEGIGTTDPSLQVIITPGLTPDGEPTSNSELSIDRSEIRSDDDYGFIIDFVRGLDQ